MRRLAPVGRRQRGGFALLAVLWVIVGLAALEMVLSLSARQGIAAAHNRVSLARAAWRAEGCLERTRAVIAAALTAALTASETRTDSRGASPWDTLDRAVRHSPLVVAAGCDITVEAAGTTIDLDDVDEEMLHHVLTSLHVSPGCADSLADALFDWRDPDDVPRTHGAERAWYEEHGRALPRNGALADLRELGRVRGFDTLMAHVPAPDSIFGVEPGRISLSHAPPLVLAALPGFTDEAVTRLMEQRLRGVPVGDLMTLAGTLSRPARDALTARYADLIRASTTEPDAWIVTSRGHWGTPAVTAVLEVRLVHAGTRAAVVRRRSWAS